jgi:SRSO17 transposase
LPCFRVVVAGDGSGQHSDRVAALSGVGDDGDRRWEAGAPESVDFAAKPQIALEQLWAAKAAGVPVGTVVADATYGNECAFREELDAMELEYVVGIGPGTSVWTPGTGPLPPKPYTGKGVRPTKLRRGLGHEPVSVKELALSLPAKAWGKVTWREGLGTDQVLVVEYVGRPLDGRSCSNGKDALSYRTRL